MNRYIKPTAKVIALFDEASLMQATSRKFPIDNDANVDETDKSNRRLNIWDSL